MNESTTITVALTIPQIQTLNNIIANSTPTIAYGVISQLVSDINIQIKQQLEDLQNPQQETPVEVDAE